MAKLRYIEEFLRIIRFICRPKGRRLKTLKVIKIID